MARYITFLKVQALIEMLRLFRIAKHARYEKLQRAQFGLLRPGASYIGRERLLADTIISSDQSRNSLLKIAAAGVMIGLLTPLLPTLIDKLVGAPGDLRIALVAVPF